MTLTEVLLGEHGAMNALLEWVEKTAPSADLAALRMQASVLRATLVTHADLEDELLRPLVRPHLPPAPPGPTDHEIIGAGLLQVESAGDAGEARSILMETIRKTRQHFLKEETLIFPTAQRELPADKQVALASEWAQRRGIFA